MGMKVKFEKKEKRKSSLENCFLNSPRKEMISVKNEEQNAKLQLILKKAERNITGRQRILA